MLDPIRSAGKIGTAVLELAGDDTKLKADVRTAKSETEASLAKAAVDLKKTGAGLTKSLTAPLVGLGLASAHFAADFEQQLNILEVSSRGSGASLEELRQVAILAGTDMDLVGVTAINTAEGMTRLARDGFDLTEILGDMNGYLEGTAELGGILRAAFDLAAASAFDQEQAVDALAVIHRTFNIDAERSVEIADLLVRAQGASVGTVEELSASMKNVGPIAAGMNIPLEDTVTALALLSERGIKGEEAGTQLKSMFMRMTSPVGRAADALDKLNMEFYDLDGTMKPIPQIFDELGVAMDGMTQAEVDKYLADIFGTYGVIAARVFFAEQSEGWEHMTHRMEDAAGITAEAEARTKGMKGQMELLQGAIQTFMIQVGTPLIENFLTPLITKATEVFGTLTLLSPEFFNWMVIIGGVLAALGPLLILLGAMLPALAVLFSPIGLIIAAVALLAAGFVHFNGGIGPTIDLVVGLGQTLYEWLFGLWERYGPIVMGIIDDVVGFLTAQVEKASTWIGENMGLIQETFEVVLPILQAIWEAVWTAIEIVVTTVWDQIKAIVSAAIDIVLGIIRAVMLAITGDWEGAWEEVKGIGERLWDLIIELLTNKWEMLKALFGETFDAVLAWWKDWSPKFQEDWNAFWGRVGEWFVKRWEDIKDFFKRATDWVTTTYRGWRDDLSRRWEEFWNGVWFFFRDTWNELKRFLRKTWDDLLGDTRASLTSIWTAIVGKIEDIWEALTAPYKWAWGTLFGEGGIFGALLRQMGEWIDQVLRFFHENLDRVRDAITRPFEAARELIERIMDRIRNAFKLPKININFRDGPAGLPIPEFSVSWFAKGLDAIIATPTIIGVGEAGPERVTVTPLRGKGGQGSEDGGGPEYHLHYTAIRREVGEMDAAAAMRRLELHARAVGL